MPQILQKLSIELNDLESYEGNIIKVIPQKTNEIKSFYYNQRLYLNTILCGYQLNPEKWGGETSNEAFYGRAMKYLNFTNSLVKKYMYLYK